MRLRSLLEWSANSSAHPARVLTGVAREVREEAEESAQGEGRDRATKVGLTRRRD
jgi:hypothetical protein